jgi:hypothetical protein
VLSWLPAAPEAELRTVPSVADCDSALLRSKLDLSKFKKLSSTDFEKDDDTNHHIDWITAGELSRL